MELLFQDKPVVNLRFDQILIRSQRPIPEKDQILRMEASSIVNNLLGKHFTLLNTSSIVGIGSYKKFVTYQTQDLSITFNLLIESSDDTGSISIYLTRNESDKISKLLLDALESII